MAPDEPVTNLLVAGAIRLSRLAAVPAELLARLLADVELIEAPAGLVRYWLRQTRLCGLLVSGVLRYFLMAAGYLGKPFDLDELLAVVARFVR